MKRIFDVFISVTVLIFFFPFGIILSLLISLSSKGGVFYLQRRIGKNKKPFFLIKFRSMRLDSDKKGKLTIGMKDNRITKIGLFIRKFKLDEFPQFINVIKGDMSIVGPRPEVAEYVKLYTKEQQRIFKVKPGITDYASLEYFKENEILANSKNPEKTYTEEIMPKKIALNYKYLDNPTLLNDLKIILKTFVKIVSH